MKQQLTQADIDRLVAETKAGRSPRNGGWGNNSSDKGLWLTDFEQFSELYQSIDDIEKLLKG